MNPLSQMQRKPLAILMAAAMAASSLAAPLAQAATIEESASIQPSHPLPRKPGEAVSSAGAKASLAKQDARAAEEQVPLKEGRTLQPDMSAGKGLSARMRGLWRHTKAYAERGMEYLRTDWLGMRNESPFKNKLIEARRFLSDAEIDQFIGREPARTRQDLKKSLGYLDEAASQARIYYTDPVYKRQIAELQKSVRKIIGNPEATGQPQFEAAKRELRLMIRSL